ncbi:hypothetical protein, partial [Paraclostridium bifermentans]|uniref:hypothetical protein n=1 Tax=Paraclostridium bifermentans TaxID=1490 RepID=UPI00374F2FDF
VNNYLQQNNLDPNGGQTTQQGQGQNQTQNQTQTKNNENAASKGSDKKVEESLENTEFTPDGSPISAEDKVTPPVFTWGKYSFTKKMHMGKVVMTKIIKDVPHLKDFEKKNKMLFMNAFGDIVTENDVVILPAASNPTLFNNNKTFYPYSLGFMKPYPNLKANENVFKVGKGDQGKYVLSIERENEVDDGSKDKEAEKKGKAKETEVISGNNLKQGNDKEVSISEVSGDTNLALSRKFSTTQFIQANMRDMGSGKTSMLRFKHYKFKSDNWSKKITSDMVNNVTSSNMFTKECLMAKVPADVISEGKSVVLFESDLKDLTDQDLGMIASNYYWGVMSDGDGNMTSPNGNLNTTLFQKWIVPQALNGVTNTQV